MKIAILSSVFIVLLSVGAFGQKAAPSPTPSPSPAPSSSKVDISGKWALAADAGGQSISILIDIKQTGATFTGTSTSDVGEGKIDGGKIDGKSFTAVMHSDVQGQPMDFEMKGTIDGDKLTGLFSNAALGTIAFTGNRSK